ncbi:MAG: hypothetical protein AAGG09_03255 [Pseudomonadota bacterium]
MTDRLQIRLFGAFSVLASDGKTRLPVGQKAKGLLALLLTAQDGRRGRRWIEARLWSDRAQEQASGSLRQTLVELRRALAAHAGVIGSDRAAVWIELDQVETDVAAGSTQRFSGRDFLEDLEIRDEGFEEWARDMRAFYDAEANSEPDAATGAPGAAPVASEGAPDVGRRPEAAFSVRSVPPDTGTPAERLVGRILADQMALGLEERLSAVRYARPAKTLGFGKGGDLLVTCDVAESGNSSMVFLQVLYGEHGRVVYSGHKSIHGGPTDALTEHLVQGLLHDASRSVMLRLPEVLDKDQPQAVALRNFNRGISRLATFDAAGFEEASDRFRRAHDADGSGVYLAWQAYVRMAQLVEKAEGDPQARLDEIKALVPQAMQTAPENGLVVALVALTRIMLEDDPSAPAELARRAMMWNKSNLFARQTLAVAYSAVGDPERAYDLSRSCQQSGLNDELSHVWDLYHSLVCIGAGRLDEARTAAERASRTSPRFVAPRRQLVALCANAGDLDAARTYLKQLQHLENDFSLERYFSDPDYPVLTLRRAGLIDRVKTVLPDASSDN